ncbi:MAG: sigma-70 family RNA polymerase sigma factor [Chloroflexota bacterium]
MDTNDWLTEGFEAHRRRLRAVAFRMLGSIAEAEDAVQEVWLDLRRADTAAIENVGKWLTTVVARVCLDKLRSRMTHREEPFGDAFPDSLADPTQGTDPEQEAVMADSLGLALFVVLDKLTPAERVAFVLHDVFDLPFDEIAPIVGRTPLAARQLASRARRRVQGSTVPDSDVPDSRRVVDAFLAASNGGDFEALLAMLDPDSTLRADSAAVRAGASDELRGAFAVAEAFAGRAHGAQLALVGGAPGLVWAPGGRPRAVFTFSFRGDKITAIDLIGDRDHVDRLIIVLLDS